MNCIEYAGVREVPKFKLNKFIISEIKFFFGFVQYFVEVIQPEHLHSTMMIQIMMDNLTNVQTNVLFNMVPYFSDATLSHSNLLTLTVYKYFPFLFVYNFIFH